MKKDWKMHVAAKKVSVMRFINDLNWKLENCHCGWVSILSQRPPSKHS